MTKEEKQEILSLIGDLFTNLKIEDLNKLSDRELTYLVGNKFNQLSSREDEWSKIEDNVLEILTILY